MNSILICLFFLLVCAVNNVVYELFNRKLYDGAFGLAVIVCQELCKDCPPSLPLDRVRTAYSFHFFNFLAFVEIKIK